MTKLTRDQIIVSNMLADVLVKTEMLFNKQELAELSLDVNRWRDGEPIQDQFIDAYQQYIADIIDDVNNQQERKQ